MGKAITALAVVLGISLLSIPTADACGDKLLRMGRGARFQRSMHPATILIYLPSTASAAASTRAPQLQSFLKKAGHKSRVVQGADRLSEVLLSGQYDVVLTDLAEVAGVQKQIESLSSQPSIVPVAFKSTKAEVSAAKKRYRCVVRNANNGDEYLDAIDEAMRSRVRVIQKKT
jgi:hypothetical protein